MNGTDINQLRQKQFRFALFFGIPYFIFIISIYLLIYLAGNKIIDVHILGLPLHYFLVAVFVYPVTWVLFIWYVKKANKMEENLSKSQQKES